MCTNRRQFADGRTAVCGRCEACRSQKFDDWIGRQIAEGVMSHGVEFVTLTFGDTLRMGERIENLGARFLQYGDVQKYLHRLRYYCDVRYFIAGEYGEKKGRGHWHLMLFYQDERRPPDQYFEKRYFQTTGRDAQGRDYPLVDRPDKSVKLLWPHGTVYWKKVEDPSSPAAYKYVTKYAVKGLKGFREEGEQDDFRQSRRPPLGAKYFIELARRYVEAGLPVRDTAFTLEGQYTVRKVGVGDVQFGSNGEAKASLPNRLVYPKRYIFTWACRKYFFEQYMRLWREEYGNDRWPCSDVLTAYLDWKAGKFLVHADQSSTVQDALVDEKNHRNQQRIDSGFAYGRPRSDMLDPEDRRVRNRLDRDATRVVEAVNHDGDGYRRISGGE